MAAASGKAVMAAAWMRAARGGSRRARGQGRGGGPACVGRAALGARSTGEEGRREKEKGGGRKMKRKEKMGKEKGKQKIKRKRERGREKRDRARASEIRGSDRGLVGHARIVGRHAARLAERKKGDETSGVRDRENFSESRVSGFRRISSSTTKNNFENNLARDLFCGFLGCYNYVS